MDDRRFDRLTAALAASLYRRRLLATVATAASSALLAWSETAVGKKKNTCPKSRRCGKRCCKAEETCKNAKKGKCVHHCKDGEKNRGETGIDCGGTCIESPGSSIGACAIGQGCDNDDDCFSGICVAKSSGKQCVFCRTDNDCDRTSSSGTRCIDNECFECAADGDCRTCCTGRPFCIARSGCPNNQPCSCGECRQGQEETDCPDPGKPVCVNGACQECGDDVDCDPGQECQDGECVVGACQAAQDFCVDGKIGCDGNDNCICRQTIGNQPFCAQPGGFLTGCTSDQFCVNGGLPSGSRCVKQREPNCETGPGLTSACAVPCG